MKAAIVPALNSAWEIRDLPMPKVGPNQVLIKIRASGICYTDVHQSEGGIPGKFPRVLGHEPLGDIIEKVMTETYSLAQITEAYQKVKNGQVRFRAVITL